MKKIILLGSAILTLVVFSCTGKVQKDVQVHKVESPHTAEAVENQIAVDNKIDPICGMETAGHVSDTIHYKDKVYGFCSSGCKEMFQETPEKYVSKMGN